MNRLDGRAILRFAHAFDRAGGMEQHLQDLDSRLTARNAVTIVRVFLSETGDRPIKTEETQGRGRIVKVALPLPPHTTRREVVDDESEPPLAKRWLRDWVLYNRLVWKVFTHRWLLCRTPKRHAGEPLGAGEVVSDLANRFRIDLGILHFMGGADSEEVVNVFRTRGIPFAVQNHFSNDRFLHLSIRKHAMLADAVAGINELDVPAYLRGRFTNLANGIDTELFSLAGDSALAAPNKRPLILQPSRITKSKGQLDVIRAAGLLKRDGIDCEIAFAGRIDSPAFKEQLDAEIAAAGLTQAVSFLGPLNMRELKVWYERAMVVAFPTYHHEGLGRVIVEAQAMQVPPVAYAIGGVPEGIVDGETGFLIPVGDIRGFADKIACVIKDPNLRRRMGLAGRAFVQSRYSLDALAERHEAFYSQLLKTAKTAAA